MKILNVKKIAAATALVAGGVSSCVNAAITFTDLGATPAGAPYLFYRLSADGSTLITVPVGVAGGYALTSAPSALTSETGTYFYGTNFDGSILISNPAGGNLSARLYLPSISSFVSLTNASTTRAQAISYDGSIIAGYDNTTSTAFAYWDNPTGSGANLSYSFHSIPMPANTYGNINSTNNTTAVGNYYPQVQGMPPSTSYVPFALDLASGTYSVLQLGNGYLGGSAGAISDNGLVIVGVQYPSTGSAAGVVWQRANTSSAFGAPTPLLTYTDSTLNGASGLSQTTGAYVVGRTTISTTTLPVIWRLSDGYFANIGGLSGYASNAALNVSANGRYVLGYTVGVNGRSWLADLGLNQSNVTWLAPNTYSYVQSQSVNTPAPSNSVIDVSNTNTSIANSAYRLNSVLNLQSMLQRLALDYDCNQFGENEMCFAAGGVRSVVTGEQTSANGANLRIAKKISDTTHVGVFFDKAWNSSLPTGMQINRSNPMIGFFAGYAESKDGIGFSTRASIGYATMGATSARDAAGLADTEAGSGETNFKSIGAQLEGAFGLKVDEWLAQPYIGARYNSVRRTGYVESNNANFPVSYDKLAQGAFTALVGIKVSGQVNENIFIKANIRAEYDINRQYSDFNSSYADGSATVNISSTAMPVITRARLVPTVGADYIIDKSQRVNLSVSEQPLNVGKSVNAMATYMVGF